MRHVVLTVLPFAALVVDTTVMPHLRMGPLVPGLSVPLVISYGLLFGWPAGLGTGFGVGLMLDLFVGRFMGLHGLAFALVGLVAGWIEPRVFKENILLPLFVGGMGGLLVYSILFGWLLAMGWPFPLQAALLGVMLPGSVVTGVLTSMVYFRLFRHWHYFRPDPRGTVVLRR